jgi:hypothetical protein
MPCASRKSRSVDPPSCQRLRQRRRAVPPAAARARSAEPAGGSGAGRCRPEQGLAGVDVAGAHHHVAGQQRRLIGQAPACAGAACKSPASGRVEGLGTQSRPAAWRPGRGPAPATRPPRRSAAGRSGAGGPRWCRRSKWSCACRGVPRGTRPASPTCPGASAARRRAAAPGPVAGASRGTCRGAARADAGGPAACLGAHAQRPAQGLAQLHARTRAPQAVRPGCAG